MIAEFPSRKWSLATVNRLLQQIDATGTIDRKPGSGRPRNVSTDQNIKLVDELVLSQENYPGTHEHSSNCKTDQHCKVICSRHHPSWFEAQMLQEETSSRFVQWEHDQASHLCERATEEVSTTFSTIHMVHWRVTLHSCSTSESPEWPYVCHGWNPKETAFSWSTSAQTFKLFEVSFGVCWRVRTRMHRADFYWTWC